ncbi:MAG: hypothetical protein IKU34_04685 [Clostridia bacterium]|nr:hypothetical protein [Clostridia bacterium]
MQTHITPLFKEKITRFILVISSGGNHLCVKNAGVFFIVLLHIAPLFKEKITGSMLAAGLSCVQSPSDVYYSVSDEADPGFTAENGGEHTWAFISIPT